jgi:hypothetical protein
MHSIDKKETDVAQCVKPNIETNSRHAEANLGDGYKTNKQISLSLLVDTCSDWREVKTIN